jgi:hypothetical protein
MYNFKEVLGTWYCKFTGEEGKVALFDEPAPLPGKGLMSLNLKFKTQIYGLQIQSRNKKQV